MTLCHEIKIKALAREKKSARERFPCRTMWEIGRFQTDIKSLRFVRLCGQPQYFLNERIEHDIEFNKINCLYGDKAHVAISISKCYKKGNTRLNNHLSIII